jgi:hypothetical protein
MGITTRGRLARARTPRGVGADFKGLGVLPALGRSGLRKARAGPDAEVGAAHARARLVLWPARRHDVGPKLIQLALFEMEKLQKLNKSAQSGE